MLSGSATQTVTGTKCASGQTCSNNSCVTPSCSTTCSCSPTSASWTSSPAASTIDCGTTWTATCNTGTNSCGNTTQCSGSAPTVAGTKCTTVGHTCSGGSCVSQSCGTCNATCDAASTKTCGVAYTKAGTCSVSGAACTKNCGSGTKCTGTDSCVSNTCCSHATAPGTPTATAGNGQCTIGPKSGESTTDYTYQYGKYDGTNYVYQDDNNGTFTGLPNEQTQYFKVRRKNDSGNCTNWAESSNYVSCTPDCKSDCSCPEVPAYWTPTSTSNVACGTTQTQTCVTGTNSCGNTTQCSGSAQTLTGVYCPTGSCIGGSCATICTSHSHCSWGGLTTEGIDGEYCSVCDKNHNCTGTGTYEDCTWNNKWCHPDAVNHGRKIYRTCKTGTAPNDVTRRYGAAETCGSDEQCESGPPVQCSPIATDEDCVASTESWTVGTRNCFANVPVGLSHFKAAL